MMKQVSIAEFHNIIYSYQKITIIGGVLKSSAYIVLRICTELCDKYGTEDFSYDAFLKTEPSVYKEKYPEIINDPITLKKNISLHVRPLSDIHQILFNELDRRKKLVFSEAATLLGTSPSTLHQFLFNCADQVSLENKNDFTFDVFKTLPPDKMQQKYPELYHLPVPVRQRKEDLNILPFNYIHQIILENADNSLNCIEFQLRIKIKQLCSYLKHFHFSLKKLQTLSPEQMIQAFGELYFQPWPTSRASEILTKKQHLPSAPMPPAPMSMPATAYASVYTSSPWVTQTTYPMELFFPGVPQQPQQQQQQQQQPMMPLPQMAPQMPMPPIFSYSTAPISLYSKQPMFQPPFLALPPSHPFLFDPSIPQILGSAPTTPAPTSFNPVTGQINAALPIHPQTSSTMRPQKTSKAHDHFTALDDERTEANHTDKEATFAKRAKTSSNLPFFSKKQSTKPNQDQVYDGIKEFEEAETTETDSTQLDF